VPASDCLIISSGTLNYGGALTVTNVGPAPQNGDGFTLFSASGYAGSFDAPICRHSTPALGGGSVRRTALEVVQTAAINPTNISYSISGTALTLSWPADHLGWRLQAQTNSCGAGLGTNWLTVPNSTNATQIVLPIGVDNGSVFFRLVYP